MTLRPPPLSMLKCRQSNFLLSPTLKTCLSLTILMATSPKITDSRSPCRDIEAENYALVAEFEEFLADTWPVEITFDRAHGREAGEIIFCWKATNHPLPLRVKITVDQFNQGRVNRRELRQQIKDCLASNLIKQAISDVNSLIRNANRKHLTAVEKSIEAWTLSTAQKLRRSLGPSVEEKFVQEIPLPLSLKSASIQALHHIVESRVNILKNL